MTTIKLDRHTGKYYVYRKITKGHAKKPLFKRTALVKCMGEVGGVIRVTRENIYCPKELIGKKVRLRVEVVALEECNED